MALDNLISVSFSSEELAVIDQALSQIEKVLKGKTVSLTPDERQQYGSIADQNKILVDKSRHYMQQRPDLIPHMLDFEEFERDYEARSLLESRVKRINSLTDQLKDTKTLLDHDNYTNTLTFYRYIRFLSEENQPGITSIYQDLKQHFAGGRPSQSDNTNSNK